MAAGVNRDERAQQLIESLSRSGSPHKIQIHMTVHPSKYLCLERVEGAERPSTPSLLHLRIAWRLGGLAFSPFRPQRSSLLCTFTYLNTENRLIRLSRFEQTAGSRQLLSSTVKIETHPRR